MFTRPPVLPQQCGTRLRCLTRSPSDEPNEHLFYTYLSPPGSSLVLELAAAAAAPRPQHLAALREHVEEQLRKSCSRWQILLGLQHPTALRQW